MKERKELLRQAAGAWKSGDKKTRGEVAAYYAERAREVQEVMRHEQLERARDMVEAKRYFFFFWASVVESNQWCPECLRKIAILLICTGCP
jgi:hypothetical protein